MAYIFGDGYCDKSVDGSCQDFIVESDGFVPDFSALVDVKEVPTLLNLSMHLITNCICINCFAFYNLFELQETLYFITHLFLIGKHHTIVEVNTAKYCQKSDNIPIFR